MSAVALLSNAGKLRPYHKSWEISSPVYTIRGRTEFGSAQLGQTSKDARPEVTSKDVIGALTKTLQRSPAFSLVSRSYIDDTAACTRSPGPQRYTQPSIISNLHHPLYSMPPTKIFAGSERKMDPPSKGPGPGDYDIDPDTFLKKQPAYGFRSREGDNILSSLAPDSGSYEVLEITRRGRVWRGPSWSLRARPVEPRKTDALDLPASTMALLESHSVSGRRILDTSGGKRNKPVPNWSFAKSKRFSI